MLFRQLSRFVAFCLVLTLAGCEDCNPAPMDGGVLPDGQTLPDARVADGGPDGGVDPVDPGPVITICPGDALPPLASGVCQATAGDGNLLITGDVLTPGEVFRGGQVLVDAAGTITCVGCDCSGQSGAASATTIVCPDGVISPGLINAHEHLRYAAPPAILSDERYEHRTQWRAGADGHTRVSAGGESSTAVVQWAELRMIMAGGTAGNTNGGRPGFVRNLDEGSTEGLGDLDINYSTFPLGDISRDPVTYDTCDSYSAPTSDSITADAAYTPHISEGINHNARAEFICLRDDPNDVIQSNTAIIHATGLLAPEIGEMASDGAAAIWSPRSNIALYGDTTRVTVFDNLGVLIALGSDWLRSGSMNMLRELQCADGLNQDYLDAHFSDEDLWLMATRNAAVVTASQAHIGTLATGMVADIAIYDGSERADHRAVIDAEAQDVALVFRAGDVVFGETSVVSVLESGCDPLDVCGAQRSACVMRELGISLGTLADQNNSSYPLFFCGVDPRDEPTCIPQRNGTIPTPEVNGSNRYTGILSAEDLDGDGLANALDNCPALFNPIRPVDDGAQQDSDTDSIGDECDPCPFDVGTTCTRFDSNDRDRDGVANALDNCSAIANASQSDRDNDQIGDECDACPDRANPGGGACPATIYEIKNNMVTVGGRVIVSQSIVTAVASSGFVVQVPVGAPSYVDENFSGIFVYTGSAPILTNMTPIAVGMTVDIDARVSTFFGQYQLDRTVITPSIVQRTLPNPVVVTPSEIDTGGARAAALEGVLVRVQNVAVTNPAPAATRVGGSSAGEFEIASGLRVDDAFFRIDPFVFPNENFLAITGVLLFRDQRHKLNPRNADDYAAGAPQLASFGPSPSYVRAGAASGATFPTPLILQLTRNVGTATPVEVTATGPGTLTITNVMVPVGSSSVPVHVSGDTPGAYVLTATLGTQMMTAMVRVLAVDEAPTMFTISPSPAATVPSNRPFTFTLTLSVPAPATGATVTLVSDISGAVFPSTVELVENQQTATFDFLAPAVEATGTLTASLPGAPDATVDITVPPPAPGTLIINEVDYDSVGTDAAEYVELYNPGDLPVSLTGKQLILVNGESTPAGMQYRTVDLGTNELAAGAYLVVRAPSVVVAGGAITVDWGTSDQIQNGPDGLFIWDSVNMVVLDKLSYEGAVSTTMPNDPAVALSLVEGTRSSLVDSNTIAGSFSRIPNGIDTNDAESDWAFTTCLSAGRANAFPTAGVCPP